MISELAGFRLARAIPDRVLAGVLSGSYKVCGGVIRNDSGQIIAHLVNASAPVRTISSFLSPVNAAFSGLNAFQLSRIGVSTQKLIELAHVGMAISGLTLAVSSAGFLFINKKISLIDKKLEEMALNVKSIREFLELQERARLISSLKDVRDFDAIEDSTTKTKMIIGSRQTLGEIHEKYKELIVRPIDVDKMMSVEEYFTITAIGHALCSAELGMHSQAVNDMVEFKKIWNKSAREFIKKEVIGKKPQRLLAKKYAGYIKSEEIADWMDFVGDCDMGIEQLDRLRDASPQIRVDFFQSVNPKEITAIGVARKLVQRDRILQGYVDQYEYFASLKVKPSEVQQYFDSLSQENAINGCYVFLANEEARRSFECAQMLPIAGS